MIPSLLEENSKEKERRKRKGKRRKKGKEGERRKQGKMSDFFLHAHHGQRSQTVIDEVRVFFSFFFSFLFFFPFFFSHFPGTGEKKRIFGPSKEINKNSYFSCSFVLLVFFLPTSTSTSTSTALFTFLLSLPFP